MKTVLESGWSPENLRKPGFAPATLIDVGASAGTPVLYEAFPDAYLVLIEPLEDFFRADAERVLAERPGQYEPLAAGVAQGVVSIDVDLDEPRLSAIMPPLEEPEGPRETRDVPMTTLSALHARDRWEPPFGIRIDTVGFEHHVIHGATELLRETQFVIARVPVGRWRKGGYRFADFIRLMDVHGFSLLDILAAPKAGPAGIIESMDALLGPVRRRD
jgi:FkbM family methyltransferase